MKIRVVSSKNEIFTLNPDERLVHLAFRPSSRDIFELVEACPKIEVIQLSNSYLRTVSRSMEMFLEMLGIELMEGDLWGHRKDICEYYEIPPSALEDIKRLKLEGAPAEEIEKVVKENKLTPEMVSYIFSRDE